MSSKTTVIAQEELQRQFSYCDKIAACKIFVTLLEIVRRTW